MLGFIRIAVISFFMLSLFASCDVVSHGKAAELSSERAISAARVLFYLHVKSQNPSNIAFKMSDMSLLTGNKVSAELGLASTKVKAIELVDKQLFVGEAFVAPGRYDGMKIKVSEAVKNGTSVEAEAVTDVRFNLSVGSGESAVITIEWDSEASFESGKVFSPELTGERLSPPARDLLLFISNSGSNYLSVIDMATERVVGALTVGNAPTSLAFNARKGLLYVLNSKDRTISEVEPFHMVARNKRYITAGADPVEMTYVPDAAGEEGKIYIANRASNDVTVMNTFTGVVSKNIPVGQGPSYIWGNTAKREVYVTNERSGNISIISAVSDSVISTIKVGSGPVGVVSDGDFAYVMNAGSSNMSIVSLSGRKEVNTIMFQNAPASGLKGFSGRLFVSSPSGGEVSFFNSNNVRTGVIKAGVSPGLFASNEERQRLYAVDSKGSALLIFNPLTEMFLKEVHTGARPYAAVALK